MPKILNCSTCAAPLDVDAVRDATVRCAYCGNTILIPAKMRGPGNVGPVIQGGGSLGSVIDQAYRLAEVARLVKAGRKLEAIKLYREIFHVGLKEAKDAVEQIAAGRPITYAHTTIGADQTGPQLHPMAQAMTSDAIRSSVKTGIWIVVGISLLTAIGGVIAAIIGFSSVFNHVSRSAQAIKSPPSAEIPAPLKRAPAPPPAPAFADIVLEFGSEGIGAGQFKDARSVAVDGEGYIYVGEYNGGRVQVFDSQGRFLTQWMTDTKSVLMGLAADRKGTVYAVHPSAILRYDGPTGRLLGKVPTRTQNRFDFYTNAFVALDGSLYVIGSLNDILRIMPDGEIKLVVKVREKFDELVSLTDLAVDGTGNIYALESKDDFILKFSPDGKFITRFGGRGNQPGQFVGAHDIAVDGQGRVYVSESGRAVQVFDANGRYIDSFGGRELLFGLVISDQNEIYASQRNRNKIVKYALNERK